MAVRQSAIPGSSESTSSGKSPPTLGFSTLLSYLVRLRCSHLMHTPYASELTNALSPPMILTGVAKFGLQGMLLGPFLVAIGATVWDALVEAQCKEAEECGTGTAASLHDRRTHSDVRSEEAGNVNSPPRTQQQRPRMERSPGEPGAVSPLSFSDEEQ